MISKSVDLTDLKMLQPELVELESNDFDFAKKISNQVSGEVHQWQTYINTLALLSFKQWLSERVDDLEINHEKCSIFQPYVRDINAVCNLRVGEFKLCLLAKESMLDELVVIPKIAFDSPELSAHFYVVIEIAEEPEEAIIRGFVCYDQLDKYRQAKSLQEWNELSYKLPLSLFDPELNHLLQYLRFLKPKAIPLPTISAEVESHGLKELVSSLPQKVINTARWLQGEMDELAENLSWQLLPPSTFAPVGMRRSLRRTVDQQHNKYQDIARKLAQQEKLIIPPEARGSCKEFNLDEITLQLSVVTWSYPEPTSEKTGEWVLLLILEALSEGILPTGTKLRVSSRASLVSEDVSQGNPYLHTAVLGYCDEAFVVTIALSNGSTITLMPFAFEPS
ncbi:MAG: DUF1822 family protein [Symploca sp. SIO3C6]|uniref:DUF1822 family protein n=1 Tax=Symploca sp. SIO1C4 TaxID=2607765 RepID=A0A6B3NDJ8_9CYAN|nr:DUF1822 family protein [Symploca sp. SIO3C6]NER28692.1 DUF1822 family protein [Symploca sp. SIO1C4]